MDLTKHKLIYEGMLTWRVAKGQKNIDLLVLLLDEFIVLLQKTDDKYILKNHSIIKSAVKDENKLTHSPIIKYGPSMLFRAVATGEGVACLISIVIVFIVIMSNTFLISCSYEVFRSNRSLRGVVMDPHTC